MSYLVLDISKYNPIEDYNAAATSVTGVIMRTGYRGSSAGTLTTDNLFETHYNGFKDTNIKIGYYWFTQAITEEEAIAEADYVHSLIKGKICDFPVYIDSEYANAEHTGRADALDAATRTACVVAFCERIKELGYRAGIYASDSWYKSNLVLSTITSHSDYSLWVARYSSTSPVNVSNYDAWQYTSDGQINGYSNRVDLSNFYNDVAGWEKEDISTKTATLSQTSYTYTGSGCEPSVTIEGLTLNTDFSVSYINNVNVGTATVTITGIGDYDGTITKTFTITPIDISSGTISCGEADSDGFYDLDNLTVTLNDVVLPSASYTITVAEDKADWVVTSNVTITGKGNYTGTLTASYKTGNYTLPIYDFEFSIPTETRVYNGSAHCPDLTVPDGFKYAVDYYASYYNNTNAGSASVVIEGIGHYHGTKTIPFGISKADLSSAIVECGEADENGLYDIENITVTLDGKTLTKGKDYDVETSTEEVDKYQETTVTVSGIRNYKGEVVSTYNTGLARVDISTLDIILSEDEFVYTGSSIKPEIICSEDLEADVDYIAVYSNNISVGKASVVISGAGDYKGSITLEFNIIAKSLKNATFVVSEEDKNGCVSVAGFSVTVDGRTLIKNTDYTFSETNVIEGIFVYTIIDITGTGNYKDNASKTFKTEKLKINIETIDFSTEYGAYTYTGSEIKPVLKTDLIEGTDYTIAYKNNINVGNGEIVITGIGDYNGEFTLTFSIEAKDFSNLVSIECGDPDSDGNYNLDKLTVTINKYILEKDTDYTSKTELVLKDDKLSAKVTVNGTGNYTGSKTSTFQIDKLDINNIEFRLDTTLYQYNGNAHTPLVIPEDKSLVQNTDYTVIYHNNINAGVATAIITGIGKYEGTVNLSFEIAGLDLSSSVVNCGEPDDDGCYNIGNLEVIYKGTKLEASVDYSLSLSSTNESRYVVTTVEIKGINNYKGSITKSYNTQKIYTNINSIVFRISETEFVYNGEEIKPEVSTNLVEGTDYTISYSDNINVGTGKINIYGIGDYNNTKQLNFTITPLGLESCTIKCGEPDENKCYDINNLTVEFNNKILVKNEDYMVSSYENIVDRYIVTTVTISGINNYSGFASGSFNSELSDKSPLSQGTKVTLKNAYIYARYGSKVPVERKSGEFYIWKNSIMNDRIRITAKEEMVGVVGQLTGWVDVSDVDGSKDNINVGDPVIVNGKTFTYPSGLGNSVARQDVVMYVVSILNADEFPCNYALASAPNRAIQGYTSIDSLVKYIV